MIQALRCGINLSIYKCSKIANCPSYSGFGRTVQYLSVRQIYDKKCYNTKSSNRGCGTSQNAAVLRAKDCQKGADKGGKGSIGSQGANADKEDNDGNKNFKWIVALLALGGLAGLMWFLNKKKKDETTPEDAQIEHVYGVKVPATSAEIPSYVPYLLIGGGTASFSAFRAIKSHDPKAKVLIISNEYLKPYMRPPLSKEMWFHAEHGVVGKDYKFKQWNGAERSIFYEADEFYVDPTKLMESENGGVSVCQGYHVKKVDSCNQQVILNDGKVITYDKCLIATGCDPKSLEALEAAPRNIKEKITKFRTPIDYVNLKHVSETKKSIVVIGSGFLGSELACALAQYGKDKDLKVYQIFHESGNMAKVLPEYLSKWTTKKIQEQGVCVIPNAQVAEASTVHNNIKLSLSNGQSILTDHIVMCVGCEPNTELASTSGLEVDNKFGGFVVNTELEARRHLFVAGDAACFYDPLLGRRRVEHHDHAVVSGRLAGENMVGLRKPYVHQSMFWSDIGPEIGYEGIGIIDSSLQTVGVFAKASPDDMKKPKSHLQDISFKSDEANKSTEQSAISESNQTETDITEKKQKHEITENSEDHYGKGVVFYLRDNKVVGILLWNLFNRINLARQIIAENKTFEDLNEVAKLFEIHS